MSLQSKRSELVKGAMALRKPPPKKEEEKPAQQPQQGGGIDPIVSKVLDVLLSSKSEETPVEPPDFSEIVRAIDGLAVAFKAFADAISNRPVEVTVELPEQPAPTRTRRVVTIVRDEDGNMLGAEVDDE